MRRVVPLFVLAAGFAVLAPCAKAEVAVFSSGDDLVIADGTYVPGEPSVPEILVTQVGNSVFIEGLNGTLVEGWTFASRSFPQDDIRIELFYGHVTVRDLDLTNRPTDDLFIETSGTVRVESFYSVSDSGSDLVIRDAYDVDILYCSVLGRLTTTGTPRVSIDTSAFARSTTLHSGSANDRLDLRWSWFGDDLELATFAGRDTIILDNVTVVDRLKIDAGSHNDRMEIDFCDVGRHAIYGGTGSDTIYAVGNDFPLTTFNTNGVEWVK